jgi:hypothetical protein
MIRWLLRKELEKVETEVIVKTGLPTVMQLPEEDVRAGNDTWLDWFNHRHAMIGDYGGKCVVLGWVPYELDPGIKVPSYQSTAAFKQRYADKYIQTLNGALPGGEFWLKHPGKRKYDRVGFLPGGPGELFTGTGHDYYTRLNLWRGWGIEPKEGEWPLLRNHLRLLAGSEEESEDYIHCWLAHTYQHPDRKTGVGLVLRGDEGVSKGITGHAIRRSHRHHGFYITQPSHLVGKFNEHLRTCCFVFVDEMYWGYKQQDGEGVLRATITDGVMPVEVKFGAIEDAPNRIDVMVASNADWIVPAGPNSRRYAVFDVDNRYAKDRCDAGERRSYFNALGAEIDGGGVAAMMYDLMRRDLSKWDPEDIPKTKALIEQKQHSLKGWDKWYETILQEGILPRVNDSFDRWDGRPDCATAYALLKSAKTIRGLESETYSALKIYLFKLGVTPWRIPGTWPRRR